MGKGHSKAALSVLSALVIVLLAASIYEEQRLNSLNAQVNSLRQNMSTANQGFDALGFTHWQVVASGPLFPTSYDLSYGTMHRIASFVVPSPGVLAIRIVTTSMGNVTVEEGAHIQSSPYSVVGNDTRVNYGLVPVIPGNVTVYFERLGGGCPPPLSCILLPASGNFSIAYYY